MSTTRAFVGLGSNVGDPVASIAAAIDALDGEDVRVAAVARLVCGPYEPRSETDAAPVVNTVAELRTTLDPEALHERLHAVEARAGRRRDDPRRRALDLDLLAYGDVVLDGPALTLPHPRATRRAFVLGPWAEIAPRYVVPGGEAAGPGATVAAHAARLRAADDGAFGRLAVIAPAPRPARAGAGVLLADRAALQAWRAAAPGPVGVVMTMGALHAGHLSLVQRARAECASVLGTLFVNPLQFAPGEDFERYPRDLDADRALLRAAGVDAVYAPDPDDLYPPGFATSVVPAGAAEGYEGAARPSHFAGVATVVTKLWMRARADRAYFGRKDAQQVAVIHQTVRDLDLPGDVVVCPTVRDLDGLALSSRNARLDGDERERALALSRALASMAASAAAGESRAAALVDAALVDLSASVDAVDYLAVVDADTLRPVEALAAPALAMVAARVGSVRLLDNAWIAPPVGVAALA